MLRVRNRSSFVNRLTTYLEEAVPVPSIGCIRLIFAFLHPGIISMFLCQTAIPSKLLEVKASGFSAAILWIYTMIFCAF
jgi:hypothetical protein